MRCIYRYLNNVGYCTQKCASVYKLRQQATGGDISGLYIAVKMINWYTITHFSKASNIVLESLQ